MRNVSKCYPNGSNALENVNIEIKKGEFVFVVGPSGAGKSTFIKMIFREELPSEGSLVVNGRNVTEMTLKDVPYLRRGLGIIFQDYRLLQDKTVYENVAFAMQVVEAPRREMQKRVNTVLDLVGLKDKVKSFPTQLSGGEQQRVAIARSLSYNPKIILADEPTGNLDEKTENEILKIFDQLAHKENKCIIIVTHSKNVANSVDQVFELKKQE